MTPSRNDDPWSHSGGDHHAIRTRWRRGAGAGIDLEELYAQLTAGTGAHWTTQPGAYWVLGVLAPGQTVIQPKRNPLGTYGPGAVTFDLYANTYGAVFTTRANPVRVRVTFGDGTTRDVITRMPG
jgi:hypothetical protein